MRKLIITADDYGMCEEVNFAIEECIKVGTVMSTNVLMNFSLDENAKTLRLKYPNLSIGIHWNITAGTPITEPALIPTLVNSNGTFHSLNEFKLRFKSKLINVDEVKLELLNQYNEFKKYFGEPAYWNTHQNSSLGFKEFELFYNFALELGITKTRSFVRYYALNDNIKGIKKRTIEFIKKKVFKIWFGHYARSKGVNTAHGRFTFFDDSKKLDLTNLTNSKKWKKDEVVELVIHPAIDASNPFYGNLTQARINEYELFSKKSTKDFLISKNIKLVGFEEV